VRFLPEYRQEIDGYLSLRAFKAELVSLHNLFEDLVGLGDTCVQLHTNVILDFGFRSKEERSSLRWIARQIGAKSQVIYLPIDPETQRKRVQSRSVERPDQTWPMSEEELMKWRAFFNENELDEAELNSTILEDSPPGYESWFAWAASRWPSFPNEYVCSTLMVKRDAPRDASLDSRHELLPIS
jgi:predicted kinase